MNELIRLDNISKKYTATPVLHNINLSLPDRGMIFIKGKSGCGKTTLLNLLGGLDSPSEGKIYYNGKSVEAYSSKEWDDYRNLEIGFVFQDFNLLEDNNVENNIEIVIDVQNELTRKEDKKKRISESLKFVGLEKYEKRKVSELSGGQKQRVAIARTISKKCKVILADEPTGNLDSDNGKVVLDLLKKISKKKLVVIVTHDIASAMEYGDRVISISDGQILEDVSLESKENNEQLYSVHVEDEKNKTVFSLSKETLKSAKEKVAEWLLLQKGTHDFRFSINESEIVRNDIEYKEDVCDHTDSKSLPIIHSFNLALQNLSHKKIRFVFTVLMFSLTILLLLGTIFVMKYDRKRTISDYMETQQTKQLYLSKTEKYVDKFFNTKANNIQKGEKFYKDLSNLLPEAKMIPRYEFDTVSLKSDSDHNIASEITMYFPDEFGTMDVELEAGRLPSETNEILITDYLEKCCFEEDDVIGKKISAFDEFDYVIVGVIKTDCIEKEIIVKEKYNSLDDFEREDLANKYKVMMALPESMELVQNKCVEISLPKSDLFLADREYHFLDSSAWYGRASLVKNKLVCGRMPEKENEILVSSSYAEMNGFEEKDLNKSYNLLNIYDEIYNNTYSDNLNIYDYFNKGMVIVGVFDEISLEDYYNADILIDDTVFDKIIDKQIKYYGLKDYVVSWDKMDYDSVVKRIDDNNYMIYEPAINKIYSFRNTLDDISDLIFTVVMIVAVITMFVLGIFISNNIKVNTRKIGVLKALGISSGQIAGIFLIETMILTVISYIVAVIMANVFIFEVNSRYVHQVAGHEIEFMYWNPKMALVVFAITIVISLCSVVLPITGMSRKKPIEIIRTVNA